MIIWFKCDLGACDRLGRIKFMGWTVFVNSFARFDNKKGSATRSAGFFMGFLHWWGCQTHFLYIFLKKFFLSRIGKGKAIHLSRFARFDNKIGFSNPFGRVFPGVPALMGLPNPFFLYFFLLKNSFFNELGKEENFLLINARSERRFE